MKNTFKLTKKAINGLALIVSDKYVSNGNWMILRSSLPPEQQPLEVLRSLSGNPVTFRELTNEQMEAVIPGEEMIKNALTYKVTPFQYSVSDGVRARILSGPDGELSAIHEIYAEWFGLTSENEGILRADKLKRYKECFLPVSSEDKFVIIMGLALKNIEDELAKLVGKENQQS